MSKTASAATRRSGRTCTTSACSRGPGTSAPYGSQGEQRLIVLALVLAEADLLRERHGIPPLLLLDDVLSELDASRRRRWRSTSPAAGQTFVTATDAAALPLEPAQLVEVAPGTARTV